MGVDGREKRQTWIYDWNLGSRPRRPPYPIELDDETLRDGLQSPSVRHPTLEEKKEILHRMAELGIDRADIGYPGSSPRAFEDVVELAREINRVRLPIRPNCAGRTAEPDIVAIAEAQQRSGVAIEAALFLGSSPIRQYVEEWDLDFLLRTTDRAVTRARQLGLRVMFVTEDTTRARPDHLRAIYRTAVDCGADRICLADTVGHATPWGTRRLVRFIRKELGPEVKVDWHGHRDRGLDLINALVALEAGANCVHGCGLGIGERVGNVPMDLLLVNLKLLGWIDRDLRKLPEYCAAISRATGIPIPCNYPVVGKDAFETSTGVHAAAIAKAFRKGDHWLANRVYSGVPAEEVGREQVITIGPMSGQANVVFWLERHGLPVTAGAVEEVLNAAKKADRVLTDAEIQQVLQPLLQKVG